MKSLLISVRFHEGRYHGTADRFRGLDGWPPSPGRLFQALVASAARGATIPLEDERALRWLEGLTPPRIVAPPARQGCDVKLYVPNNDLDAVGGDPSRIPEIRDGKTWRPCFFNPDYAIVYAWDFDSDLASTQAAQICTISERLYQLGRGVDPAWAIAEIVGRDHAAAVLYEHPGALRTPSHAGEVASPHSGTLDSLIERHRWVPFSTVSKGRKRTTLFAQAPKPSFRYVGYDTQPQRLYFELRGESGFVPIPLCRAASLVTVLRDSAASRLKEALPEETARIERLIVGRGAGPSDLAQRIRIVPIPSIGHGQVDPAIRRIMVEVPVECPIRADDLRWAFLGLEPCNPETGETWGGRLVSAEDSQMAQRFLRRTRLFRSLTPVALPNIYHRGVGDEGGRKQPSGRSEKEARVAGAVVQALRHVGVRARPTDIKVQREPFQRRGTRAEAFAAGTRFPKEALWHVSVSFAEPIDGPLVLGDGRYLGLGLMCPAEPKSGSGVLAFTIEDGLADSADSSLVARAARRAMMARVQGDLPRGARPPSYVSGHGEDGAPLRGGTHRHIAVAVDLPRRRLLYIAPSRLQRRSVRWSEVRGDHGLVERALEGMDILLAGKAGRLVVGPSAVDAESDPLFAPARVWESVTDYSVTRHRRRLADEEALRADALEELRRCGWPVSESIEVSAALRGPRGGLTGRLRITFAVAQKGPLLLGRTAHKGGGLFVGSI